MGVQERMHHPVSLDALLCVIDLDDSSLSFGFCIVGRISDLFGSCCNHWDTR